MEGWNHGIIISFKQGASGRIGWSALANAKPDGYYIGFVPTALLIPAITEDVPFGYDKFSYIFNMMSDPGAIGVAKDSPYNTIKDIVTAVKERPGEISFGVYFYHRPGRSAVVGKHMDAFCFNVGDTTTFVEDGSVKIVATGGEKRSVFMPDIPTYQESGYDVIQVNMRSISGPVGIPVSLSDNILRIASWLPQKILKSKKRLPK